MKSDFGKGCAYCLGLFLAHAFQFSESGLSKEKIRPSLVMNAASDHLYDLVIPENYPVRIKNRLKKLQSKSLGWGMGQEWRQER